MNWKAKEQPATPAAPSPKEGALSYSGSGKVSVSVERIVNSSKVLGQVAAVREIAAQAATDKRK